MEAVIELCVLYRIQLSYHKTIIYFVDINPTSSGAYFVNTLALKVTNVTSYNHSSSKSHNLSVFAYRYPVVCLVF